MDDDENEGKCFFFHAYHLSSKVSKFLSPALATV